MYDQLLPGIRYMFEPLGYNQVNVTPAPGFGMIRVTLSGASGTITRDFVEPTVNAELSQLLQAWKAELSA